VAVWEKGASSIGQIRVLAVVSVLLWCAVIVAGRWIAYADVPAG